MCEPLGLWCAAYSSGLIALRGLRALSLSQDPADRPASDTQLLPLICSLQVQPCSPAAWHSHIVCVSMSLSERWDASRATRGAEPPRPCHGPLSRPPPSFPSAYHHQGPVPGRGTATPSSWWGERSASSQPRRMARCSCGPKATCGRRPKGRASTSPPARLPARRARACEMSPELPTGWPMPPWYVPGLSWGAVGGAVACTHWIVVQQSDAPVRCLVLA